MQWFRAITHVPSFQHTPWVHCLAGRSCTFRGVQLPLGRSNDVRRGALRKEYILAIGTCFQCRRDPLPYPHSHSHSWIGILPHLEGSWPRKIRQSRFIRAIVEFSWHACLTSSVTSQQSCCRLQRCSKGMQKTSSSSSSLEKIAWIFLSPKTFRH